MPSLQQLLRLFPDFTPGDVRLEPVAGDASSRKYFRVFSHGSTSILCVDNAFAAFSGERYPFLAVQKLLSAASVPVPAVIGHDKSHGLILLEDCGDTMLQNLPPGNLREAYRKAVDIMVAVQSISGRKTELPFNRSFDEEKLMFEFDFFLEHAPRGAFPEKTRDLLRNEFLSISQRMQQHRHFVLNHRDYHSRNILVRDKNLFVIDFQDARMGLPQYDAVSLLRDSYAALPDELFAELRDYHYGLLRENALTVMSRDEYLYFFDLAAFQRNVKALGTYFNQARNLGKRAFERYIPTALAYLRDYMARQGELAASGDIIVNRLADLQP